MIKHLFIKGVGMIGLEFLILFAYSNKEAAQPSGYSTGLAIVTPWVQACQLGLFLAVPRSAAQPSV